MPGHAREEPALAVDQGTMKCPFEEGSCSVVLAKHLSDSVIPLRDT